MPTDNILSQLAGEGHTRPEVARTKAAQKLQHGQTDIAVIPYNASFHDDAQNFLPFLWNKLKEDGLIELYFPGESKTGFANFVRLMSGDSKILLVVGKDNAGKLDKAIGFASWRPMPFGATQAGMAGFVFLREFWDGKITDVAAQRIMEHWFDSEQMDLMIGCVADLNHPANKFMERIGWAKVGIVPMAHIYKGVQCGSVIWQITKDVYKAR